MWLNYPFVLTTFYNIKSNYQLENELQMDVHP